MPRPTSFLALLPLLACSAEPVPDTDPDPTPIDDSLLSRCLLDGGQLETAWSVTNDAAGITALAVAPDGTLAYGEGLGATWRLPGALADPLEGPPADVVRESLVPAGGHAVTTATFSPDGSYLATGNARGQIYAEGDEGYVWWEVSDEPLRSVATPPGSAYDQLFGWVDEGFGGRPTLAGWTDLSPEAAPPPPVETELWQAGATAFAGNRWILAGDWYGVPSIDLRDLDDPDAPVLGWSAPDAGGSFHAVQPTADDRLVAAGPTHPHAEVAGFVMVVGLEAFDDRSLAQAGPEPLHRIDTVDHAPVAAHLLPGDEVVITRGAEGTLRAWTVDGLEPLASLAMPAAASSALDPTGQVLVVGDDGAGAALHGVACAP